MALVVWVLGIKPVSSARAAKALSHWATEPSLLSVLLLLLGFVLLFLLFYLFWYRVARRPGWFWTCSIAEDDLGLMILLPLHSKCWDYWYWPPCSARETSLNMFQVRCIHFVCIYIGMCTTAGMWMSDAACRSCWFFPSVIWVPGIIFRHGSKSLYLPSHVVHPWRNY